MGNGDQERKKTVLDLHQAIKQQNDRSVMDMALWQAVIAYQEYPFFTSSGLAFSYSVKRNRNGDYSGELIVSRKEDSKTLTKSSVLLAFHKVLEQMKVIGRDGDAAFTPVFCKGPKSIGQIFGISYIYSIFRVFGLIEVPEKVEIKMKGTLIK